MIYLVSAYSLIFLFVFFYFVSLGVRQKRLAKDVALIKEMLVELDGAATGDSPDG